MADRYWVGGSGTWNTTSTTNWSATPGGASGASVPTAADSVFFDRVATYTVTMTGALVCLDITVSAGTVTFATGISPSLAVSGSMSLVSGTVWNSTATITFNATTAKTITSNGVTISGGITFNGAGGSWALQDALTTTNTRTVTLTAGTLDLNSKTLTCGLFLSNNTNTRAIAFGTGNITLIGSGSVWSTSTITNFTTTGTQVVNVSNPTASAASVSTNLSLSEANCISFNFTTGTYTLTLTTNSAWRDINYSGFSGTVANTNQTIYGNVTLSSTATYNAGTSIWTFRATSGTKTITSNGKTMDWPLIFNGIGGTWAPQDALTMGSTRVLTHTNGTLDLNGKTLTVGTGYTTATGTKNLTFNGGTLVCPAATGNIFNNAAPTNFTTTAGTGTGTISITGAGTVVFVGNGATFNCTLNMGSTGQVTITGANTFDNITNTVQPATVQFASGATNTFNNFSLSGTAGNLISIRSNSIGVQATVSKSSGTVSCDYLSIRDMNATGGASWYAGANSTNVSNNTGWIFTAPPAPGYSITALNGSYSIAGQTATLSRDRNLSANAGSYSVAGQSATLSFGRLLSAQNGVYSVAGQAVDISIGIPPTPITAIEYFVEIRSFTERRRF